MDRKNEKVLLPLGDEELSTVAGGEALGFTLGAFSPNFVLDASQHINNANLIQVAAPTLVNVGGVAAQGPITQVGAITQNS
jgi:hypothetical protein